MDGRLTSLNSTARAPVDFSQWVTLRPEFVETATLEESCNSWVLRESVRRWEKYFISG